MISRAFVLASLSASLAACAASSSPGPASPGPAAAAVTNTSIATARPLAVGDVIDLVLPCTGHVYFGPAQFTAEGQRLTIDAQVQSVTGAQVCGGGASSSGGASKTPASGPASGWLTVGPPHAATSASAISARAVTARP